MRKGLLALGLVLFFVGVLAVVAETGNFSACFSEARYGPQPASSSFSAGCPSDTVVLAMGLFLAIIGSLLSLVGATLRAPSSAGPFAVQPRSSLSASGRLASLIDSNPQPSPAVRHADVGASRIGMRRCPACRMNVPGESEFCPACGKALWPEGLYARVSTRESMHNDVAGREQPRRLHMSRSSCEI